MSEPTGASPTSDTGPATVVDGPPWQATGSAISRLVAGGVVLLAGLLAGRPEVVVLGAPLVLPVVWDLLGRRADVTAPELDSPRTIAGRGRIESTLRLRGSDGGGTARLRVAAPGHRDREVVLDASADREVTVAVTTARTGRQRVFRTDVERRSAGAAARVGPSLVASRTVLVLPGAARLGDLPLPHRLRGLAGAHRSVQPGDGGELRDIAEFGPGDRLRRIDWKATARRSAGSAPATANGPTVTDLYVRRTFATADANVVLVLDARDAVGPDVSTWASGDVHPDDETSLDLARRAAASLARRYLDQGDRVGLVTLGRHRRPVRPAAGRRHLSQLVHHLAEAEPAGEPTAHRRAPQLPSGVLVVVLSTFLDDDAAHLAQLWRHTGHRTVAVDVCPSPVLDRLAPRGRAAYQLIRIERSHRLAAVAASGVEVVRWDRGRDDRQRVEVVLAALSRTRRAGR